MNLLLSYPRSGNTWYRYCVEALTKRKTHGYLQDDSGHFDKNHLGSYVNLGVNDDGPDILTKRHAVEDLNKPVEKLILIVRNYKEVLIRHRRDSWNSAFDLNFLESSCVGQNSSMNYLTMIEYFDRFNGPKLIVYYEDLITNLRSVLIETSIFLQEGGENIENFLASIKEHKENSLKIYGGSQTKGNSTTHHSKVLTKEQKVNWDSFVESYNPEIFKKYLTRYKEV